MRERLELSEAQLAASAGVVEGTVRSLESGNSAEPKLGAGLRMAEALKVSPWFLAFGEEPRVVRELHERLEALAAEDHEATRGIVESFNHAFLEVIRADLQRSADAGDPGAVAFLKMDETERRSLAEQVRNMKRDLDELHQMVGSAAKESKARESGVRGGRSKRRTAG